MELNYIFIVQALRSPLKSALSLAGIKIGLLRIGQMAQMLGMAWKHLIGVRGNSTKQRILMLSSVMFISLTHAGPGHDHGESAFSGNAGPATHFELTHQQMVNLDIQSESATFLPLGNAVDMLAFTELLPEKQAAVAPRFGGKVIDIAVKVGETIKKGQRLVTLKPVSLGNKDVVLFAPIDGFVLNIQVGVGEIVEAGTDLLELGAASQLLVRGVAYETPDIQTLKVGQRAQFHLDIAPNRPIEGTLQRINRVIDPETRTFSIYALIDTPKQDIQVGLQGTLEVFAGDGVFALVVPKRAVLGELGSYFVYVIKDHAVEKRDVTVSARTAHKMEITSGLFPYETVVTKGNYQLQYITVGGIQAHGHGEASHDHSGMSHGKDHEGMNHEGMNHEGMNHEGMNHEGMNHEGMSHEGMSHEGMSHEGMNHDNVHNH